MNDLNRCGDPDCKVTTHLPAGRGRPLGDNLELVEDPRELVELVGLMRPAIAAIESGTERDRPIVTESELRLMDGNR